MQQPPGFVDSEKPDYVCKLQRAIYGLKHAPRAWYEALSLFLLDYGFLNSKANTSLFIYFNNSLTAYMLVYVNDITFIGNNEDFHYNIYFGYVL